MRIVRFSTVALCGAAVFVAGCSEQPVPTGAPSAGGSTSGVESTGMIRIDPGPDAPKQAQTAMINAKPGDVIEFGAGRFDFTSTLSLDASDVTVRGQGPDKTILSFKDQGQGTGGEGLLVTSKENVTIEDLAVEDARGDAIKAQGTRQIIFRNLRAEWTGGPKETNGGYGFYPVLCTDVVIEDCTAIGASDAGIYVGQSENIIVRRNTVRARTWRGSRSRTRPGPTSTRTSLPTTPAASSSSRCPTCPRRTAATAASFKNTGARQQPREFRPQGEHRGERPAGHRDHGHGQRRGRDLRQHDREQPDRGPLDRQLSDHRTSHSRTTKYDPFCEAISRSRQPVRRPTGRSRPGRSASAGQGLGNALPDILYDGVVDPEESCRRQAARRAGDPHPRQWEAGFANFDAPRPDGIRRRARKGKTPNIVRDLEAYDGTLAGVWQPSRSRA